jgi:hypothetical protein
MQNEHPPPGKKTKKFCIYLFHENNGRIYRYAQGLKVFNLKPYYVEMSSKNLSREIVKAIFAVLRTFLRSAKFAKCVNTGEFTCVTAHGFPQSRVQFSASFAISEDYFRLPCEATLNFEISSHSGENLFKGKLKFCPSIPEFGKGILKP